MLNQRIIDRAHTKSRNPIELSDSGGLSILIYASGAKKWRYRYSSAGHRKSVVIGDYPALSLKAARLLVSNIADSNCDDVLNQHSADEGRDMTFIEVADEWFTTFQAAREYSSKHLSTISYRLEHYINPNIGGLSIAAIKRPQLTRFLTSISTRGKNETAKRAAGIVQQVFLYAQDCGYIESNPASSLRHSLPHGEPAKHFAHLTNPKAIGRLIAAIRNVHSVKTRTALLLAAYCFPRCGEMLQAAPSEFDLNGALWTIPAAHTKRRRELCVPLAPQVVEMLRTYMSTLDATASRVFPQCEAALLKVLNTITKNSDGAIPKVTIHGFRHTASTVLYSLGYNTMWIEHELAHVDPHAVRGIYNSYDFLDERRGMMEQYATWLDKQASAAAD